MSEPTTEAGRRLLEMLELRWVDEPTNRGMADREWVHAIAAIEAEARAAALVSFTDLLDSIDSIVDDTHPEGDGCSLCEALDDMRALLDAETAGADAEVPDSAPVSMATEWRVTRELADLLRAALLHIESNDPPETWRQDDWAKRARVFLAEEAAIRAALRGTP